MAQTWLDPIAAAEYHEHLTAHDPAQDALQTYRERLSHPYDWYTFAYLVRQGQQVLQQEPPLRRLVAVGSGTGYEVAMLVQHLPPQQCILADLSYRLLSLSRSTFTAQGQAPPTCILADYSALPFVTFGDDTVAVAFRCLHYAADMPKVLHTLRELFSRAGAVLPARCRRARLDRTAAGAGPAGRGESSRACRGSSPPAAHPAGRQDCGLADPPVQVSPRHSQGSPPRTPTAPGAFSGGRRVLLGAWSCRWV